MIGFTALMKKEIETLKTELARKVSREIEFCEHIDSLKEEIISLNGALLNSRSECARLRVELFEAQSRIVSIPVYTEVQPV